MPKTSNVILETKRLCIRSATAVDTELFYALWRDPKVMANVGFPQGLPITRDEILEKLSSQGESEFDGNLVIELKASGQAIGECKLALPDEQGIAEPDVKLLPEFWGHHYGVEAWRALAAYEFAHTTCTAVQATPNMENIASIKMQEAAGARRVGEGVFEFPESMRAWTKPVHHYVYRLDRAAPLRQRATGTMQYPARGTVNRILFQLPKIAWRMGLGPIQGRWMLVLSTIGRKSGLPRHTMLTFTAYQGRPYLISGWNERSDWYQNLLANPLVTIQWRPGTTSALARRVTEPTEFRTVMERNFATGGDSHFKPWLKSLDIAYDLEDCVAKRERVFLIALDPTSESGPPPMSADLQWVWAAMGVSFLLGFMLGRSNE